MNNEELDLNSLERIAQAATPGPWTTFDEDGEAYSSPPATGAFLVEYGADAEQKMRDIRHIATFDPPTVLALIARVRHAEAAIDTTYSILNEHLGLDHAVQAARILSAYRAERESR